MINQLVACAAFAALSMTNAMAQPAAKVSLVFDKPVPNVPGKSMRGVMVDYAPGASSPSHTHPPSAFIYATVLEGEVRSQINDRPEQTLKAGENFYEMPGEHHGVSANASTTRSARVLAVFVVDTGEKTLTTADPR